MGFFLKRDLFSEINETSFLSQIFIEPPESQKEVMKQLKAIITKIKNEILVRFLFARFFGGQKIQLIS